jgi:RNA polymerase sigma-70 factor (ECF subfamily)
VGLVIVQFWVPQNDRFILSTRHLSAECGALFALPFAQGMSCSILRTQGIRSGHIQMFMTPASLLYRLKKPEETAAWGRFVDLYTPLLFHWAQQLGQQDSDCADLVQDVFLILWRKLPEFEYDTGRSFHAWLKTIFLNRYRSRLRQRNPRSVEMDGHDRATDFEDQLAHADDTRYLIRQAFRLIEREFSPLQQQVFRAYVLEERAPEDVAREVGISPGTVYSIKSKILSRLRQELQQLLE